MQTIDLSNLNTNFQPMFVDVNQLQNLVPSIGSYNNRGKQNHSSKVNIGKNHSKKLLLQNLQVVIGKVKGPGTINSEEGALHIGKKVQQEEKKEVKEEKKEVKEEKKDKDGKKKPKIEMEEVVKMDKDTGKKKIVKRNCQAEKHVEKPGFFARIGIALHLVDKPIPQCKKYKKNHKHAKHHHHHHKSLSPEERKHRKHHHHHDKPQSPDGKQRSQTQSPQRQQGSQSPQGPQQRGRSPSPQERRPASPQQRPPSPQQRPPSPQERRSPSPQERRPPSPQERRSPSPQKEGGQASPQPRQIINPQGKVTIIPGVAPHLDKRVYDNVQNNGVLNIKPGMLLLI